MQLEEGKFYRTVEGTKIGPTRRHDGVYPWSVNSQRHPWYYNDNGTAGDGSHPEADVIAEWVDKPAANDPIALTNERHNTHGDWLQQASISQELMGVIGCNDGHLNDSQKEALQMIAVKISRILSGDPNHADHWDDIAGYAYLGKGGHK